MKQRCVHEENGKQCRRRGEGDPPLCSTHEAQGLLGQILANDQIKAALNRLTGSLEQAATNRASALFARLDGFLASLGAPKAAPDAPPPKAEPEEDPRVVLGFAADARLTPAMVKERKRELAKLFHPDKHGSAAAMQRVNAAADLLLKNLINRSAAWSKDR